MNINLKQFGTSAHERVSNACQQLTLGKAIVLMDDPDRENEGDLIASAELISDELMAKIIKDCSGIVCLTLTDEHVKQLELPQMVKTNESKNQTAFTISIEAKKGVTTGVSAADRVQTIKTAIASNAKAEHLARPGHVFPLRAHPDGVLARRGHTEGSIDLCKLAGLSPTGVICELMHDDGTMMKGSELVSYALEHSLILLTIEDIVEVIKASRTNHLTEKQCSVA